MHRHQESRFLPYKPEQLFNLVLDIERYPEFLPWCLAAIIREKTNNKIIADLVIGFRMFREKFTSHVNYDHDNLKIEVSYINGPFQYLHNYWIFKNHNVNETEIDFFVEFKFKSLILEKLMGLLFDEAVKKMVSAFENRAHHLYGK
ncbi:MAG: type II toxin-antitoxin system RatA family toxin [Alphaproteobacteria bacterium]|nr:type II toxin-antitoxin system RatA family toxin [Alphaproteobacteria bacterium]